MTAPDHRGETERWTLHWNPIMSNSLGVPTDCYWQGVYHNPDCPLPKHIEVVPAAALDAERERADFLMAEGERNLHIQIQRAEEHLQAWKNAHERINELTKRAEAAEKEVKRLRVRANEMTSEYETLHRNYKAAEAKIAKMRDLLHLLIRSLHSYDEHRWDQQVADALLTEGETKR